MIDHHMPTVQTVGTPDGEFTIIADARGNVLASGWTADPWSLSQRIHPSVRPSDMREGTTRAADAVTDYYAGDTRAVTMISVLQRGTALQEHGWAMLRTIPVGRHVTYAEFAAKCGNPSAARSAASICARNAAGLFVPCHRVLGSDGKTGGFAWGMTVKRSLLERETQVR
jgi:methylated-DNA-[protein]-cysteine S-methyltransferase